MPGELVLFIPERSFFLSWADPPCTRNAVTGKTMEAGAGLWVVFVVWWCVWCANFGRGARCNVASGW